MKDEPKISCLLGVNAPSMATASLLHPKLGPWSCLYDLEVLRLALCAHVQCAGGSHLKLTSTGQDAVITPGALDPFSMEVLAAVFSESDDIPLGGKQYFSLSKKGLERAQIEWCMTNGYLTREIYIWQPKRLLGAAILVAAHQIITQTSMVLGAVCAALGLWCVFWRHIYLGRRGKEIRNALKYLRRLSDADTEHALRQFGQALLPWVIATKPNKSHRLWIKQFPDPDGNWWNCQIANPDDHTTLTDDWHTALCDMLAALKVKIA